MASASSRTKSGQFTKEKNEDIRKQVSGISSEKALQSIATAQSAVGKTFAGLAEEVQTQLQELERIKLATNLEREEQERIHGAAAIAQSIEEAQAAFDAKKAELARKELEENIAREDRRAAAERSLTAEIQSKQDQQSKLNEQWNFTFEQRKRNETTQYEESQRKVLLEESLRKEALARDWAAREEALKARETELAQLQAKVSGFPEELKKAVDAAVAVATSSLARDHKHAIETLQTQQNAERSVLNGKLESFNNQLNGLSKSNDDLNTQLSEANKKVQEIATKALESASGRQSIADFQSLSASSGNGARKQQ